MLAKQPPIGVAAHEFGHASLPPNRTSGYTQAITVPIAALLGAAVGHMPLGRSPLAHMLASVGVGGLAGIGAQGMSLWNELKASRRGMAAMQASKKFSPEELRKSKSTLRRAFLAHLARAALLPASAAAVSSGLNIGRHVVMDYNKQPAST